jgi:hypothetical protein
MKKTSKGAHIKAIKFQKGSVQFCRGGIKAPQKELKEAKHPKPQCIYHSNHHIHSIQKAYITWLKSWLNTNNSVNATNKK